MGAGSIFGIAKKFCSTPSDLLFTVVINCIFEKAHTWILESGAAVASEAISSCEKLIYGTTIFVVLN